MGTNSNNIQMDQSEKCWIGFREISSSLLADLKAEPFTSAKTGGPEAMAALLASLRRETIIRPVIFIGAGTCGLGAGAAKTIEAIKNFLAQRKKDADVIEVGCNGMCSDEPIVDIQIPGFARVSFGPVTADKVDALLDSVLFQNRIPEGLVLGQYSIKGAKAWDGVPALESHPFLTKQVRVVLASSGIIDPSNINEYIARGGYSAIAKILRTMTPDEVAIRSKRAVCADAAAADFLQG